MRRALLALFVSASLAVGIVASSQRLAFTADEKEISGVIGTLRSLEDGVRAKTTKELALKIRALPATDSKSLLAGSLANLATEGDFGRDTLQEVTTTLALALKETPIKPEQGKPAYAYTQLAQLYKYERMKVEIENDAQFKAALAELNKVDDARAKVDFTLSDITGKSWTRSSLKGKVVLVNFWATWCPPCRKEMPDMETLYNRFKDKGFVILAISDETEDKVKPFIAEHKYTFPVLLDPGRKVNDAYQIGGIPKSFIYGRDGKLAAQTIDMRTMDQFLELLARAGLK